MKLGIFVVLAAMLLSGCALNGVYNTRLQEAYYVPVILSDRHAQDDSVHPIHMSDREVPQSVMYSPVIYE